MTIAAVTRAAATTLHDECVKLEIMLRQIKDGSFPPATPGRFTVAEINAQMGVLNTALDAAIAA